VPSTLDAFLGLLKAFIVASFKVLPSTPQLSTHHDGSAAADGTTSGGVGPLRDPASCAGVYQRGGGPGAWDVAGQRCQGADLQAGRGVCHDCPACRSEAGQQVDPPAGGGAQPALCRPGRGGRIDSIAAGRDPALWQPVPPADLVRSAAGINFNAGDHSVSISMPFEDYQRVEQPRLGQFAQGS
jgi:hypothetical protein